MFDHPDTDDFVEGPVIGQIPVIAHLDPTTTRKPLILNPPPGKIRLLFAQGNTEGFNAVPPGRMHNQATPSASNVEQSFSRPETEFLANILKFALLRRIQILVQPREVGAGIDHATIQP
jgi:hypothetical protein